MSFYFAFEESGERRRLDGHTVYEPTPEEIETLKTALMEYAVGLFEYLHESKPDTFYSVTPIIDAVSIHPEEEYQLKVDVTFNVLYNEAPDDAPEPHEVAAVLVGAFTTPEFMHYYLWGHGDIWDHVSSVKVEPNLPDHPDEEFSDPEADVYATMVYDFGIDPTSDASEADYDTLVSLTEAFFSDLLTDLYQDNADTNFEALSIERHATTFDLGSTPPVLIDFAFKVEFDEESAVIPSTDDLFSFMAQTMFDDYIRLYLEPSESIWSTVDRVGLLEYSPPEGTDGEAGEPLPPPQSGGQYPGSMIHSFFDGMASRPDKEAYDKLEMATNFFFIETLTKAFANNNVTTFLMATTEIASTFYDETAKEPLQVDYVTSAFFEGVGPDPDTVFSILEKADYNTYIMDFLWAEGEPWNNINGVMYMRRIPVA